MWRSQLGGGALCHTEDGWTGNLSITKISQCLLGWEESFGSGRINSRSARCEPEDDFCKLALVQNVQIITGGISLTLSDY